MQARIYFNLAKIQSASAKDISRVTKVAQTDLYRIIPDLEQLGLVERKIGKPVTYEATDIITGLSILRKRNEYAYSENARKIDTLIKKSKNIFGNTKAEPVFDSIDFKVISSVMLLERRFNTLILESKQCDFLFPTKGLNVLLRSHYTSIKLSLKKGLKIRILVYQNNHDAMSRTVFYRLHKLSTASFFQIKFVDVPINFGVAIFDNMQVDMNISTNSVVPSLYSSNHAFVESVKTLFTTLWLLENENASSLV